MFKGPSFPSIHEARANVQGFLDQTELKIRKAKGEQLTPEELMLEAVNNEPSLINKVGTFGLRMLIGFSVGFVFQTSPVAFQWQVRPVNQDLTLLGTPYDLSSNLSRFVL